MYNFPFHKYGRGLSLVFHQGDLGSSTPIYFPMYIGTVFFFICSSYVESIKQCKIEQDITCVDNHALLH